MSVAKGQIQPDKSYSYSCGKCQGQAYANQKPCNYCFNGSYTLITEALKTARGEQYYSLLKAALRVSGKAIHDTALELKSLDDKITPPMLGYLSFHFQINFKALGEWLEETHVLPTGAISNLYESRYTYEGHRVSFRVKHAVDAGQAWYETKFNKKPEIWKANSLK